MAGHDPSLKWAEQENNLNVSGATQNGALSTEPHLSMRSSICTEEF